LSRQNELSKEHNGLSKEHGELSKELSKEHRVNTEEVERKVDKIIEDITEEKANQRMRYENLIEKQKDIVSKLEKHAAALTKELDRINSNNGMSF
jgi:ubiquinone biosynthesis protein UbiJ